jgi:hypothetical protein
MDFLQLSFYRFEFYRKSKNTGCSNNFETKGKMLQKTGNIAATLLLISFVK